MFKLLSRRLRQKRSATSLSVLLRVHCTIKLGMLGHLRSASSDINSLYRQVKKSCLWLLSVFGHVCTTFGFLLPFPLYTVLWVVTAASFKKKKNDSEFTDYIMLVSNAICASNPLYFVTLPYKLWFLFTCGFYFISTLQNGLVSVMCLMQWWQIQIYEHKVQIPWRPQGNSFWIKKKKKSHSGVETLSRLR